MLLGILYRSGSSDRNFRSFELSRREQNKNKNRTLLQERPELEPAMSINDS